MSRLVILASVVVLAAGSANCANAPGESNSFGDIGPSAVMAAPSAAADGASFSPAGKGGGKPGGGGGTTGGSGSLALVMVIDANGNGSPNWGDSVKFTVSTTATTEPYVSLTCTQNGVVVYGAQTGYFASYPWPWTQTMSLSSTAWQGGAANCIARLSYYSGTTPVSLGSLSFTAGA